jgi:hypothetical protein
LWYGSQQVSIDRSEAEMRKAFVIFVVLYLSSLALGQAADSSQPATKQDVMLMFQEMRFEEQMKGIQQSVAQQFQGMANQVMQRADVKNLTPEKQKRFQDLMEQEMRQSVNVYPVSEMIDDFAPVYAKYLTKADVKGITDFYHSPAGKKLLDISPSVSQEAMTIIGPKMQERMMKSMDEMQRRAQEIFGDSKPGAPHPPSKN